MAQWSSLPKWHLTKVCLLFLFIKMPFGTNLNSYLFICHLQQKMRTSNGSKSQKSMESFPCSMNWTLNLWSCLKWNCAAFCLSNRMSLISVTAWRNRFVCCLFVCSSSILINRQIIEMQEGRKYVAVVRLALFIMASYAIRDTPNWSWMTGRRVQLILNRLVAKFENYFTNSHSIFEH